MPVLEAADTSKTYKMLPISKNRDQLAVLVTGPLLRITRRFFHSNSRNQREYSLHLSTEGWPGWVGMSGLENTGMLYPPKVVNSDNRAQSSLTLLTNLRNSHCVGWGVKLYSLPEVSNAVTTKSNPGDEN